MEEARLILILTLIGWCATSSRCNFTKDEAEIVLSSLRLFKIGECVLVAENDGGSVADVVRRFGENRILTGLTRMEEAEEHLGESKPPDALRAIVVKVTKSSEVKSLLVKNSKRLHWFIWFLITEDDLDPRLIPFNCQLFKITRGPHRNYRLVEFYHLKNTFFKNEFGIWSRGEGLRATSPNIYSRRKDMKGVPIEITVCKLYSMEEYLRTFWSDYSEVLNFSLIMKPYDRRKKQRKDGTTCISVITDLDSEKDWIFSHFGKKVKLTMKLRATNEVGWRAYVQPFTKEMWAAVGVWFLLSTTAMVAVNGGTTKSLYLNVFSAFYCLCSSDPMATHPSAQPIPLRTRIVYLMSLAVPAVIVPAYSAYILSTLSVTLPLEPFFDIKGFIADGTYKLAVVENTFTSRYLKGSNDPDLKYINEHLSAENRPPTFSALFETLCRDNTLVGLFVDSRTFRSLFRCRMFVVRHSVITISAGILLSKGTPLRKMLNERFAEYDEMALRRKTTDRNPYFEKSFVDEGEDLVSLSFSQIQPLLLLVLLGAVLSLVVFAVEVAVERVW